MLTTSILLSQLVFSSTPPSDQTDDCWLLADGSCVERSIHRDKLKAVSAQMLIERSEALGVPIAKTTDILQEAVCGTFYNDDGPSVSESSANDFDVYPMHPSKWSWYTDAVQHMVDRNPDGLQALPWSGTPLPVHVGGGTIRAPGKPLEKFEPLWPMGYPFTPNYP